MSSLKKLKKSLEKDVEEIFSTTRKELSKKLTQKKLKEFKQVTKDFVHAQNYFLKNFAGLRGLAHLSYPHGLRDLYVEQGLPADLLALGLQDRQWKMALDVSFGNIKASHVQTQDAVKKSLNRTQFSDSEKHWFRSVLKVPQHLYFICLGDFKQAQTLISSRSEWKDLNQRKLMSWLRRRYRKLHARHQRPVIRKFRTYHVDSSMFKFFKEEDTCYISVASKTPRKRIIIPLTNSSLNALDFSGNIKVVLRLDGKVEVHRSIHQVIKKSPVLPEAVKESPDQFKISSIDKGYSCLIHTDSEKMYGAGFSKTVSQYSDELTALNAGRGRFHSLVRELEKQAKSTQSQQAKKKIQMKISRIQKNNLGSVKITAKREFFQNELKKEIGTAVHEYYRCEQPQVVISENLRFTSFRYLGKRVNRLLNSWSKGILRDALEKRAKMSGALLEEINAAFTSQRCRNCDFVHRENRQGNQFDCVLCGHKENADFAAAKNIRERFFDSEISVYTPVAEVKKILAGRHRVRLSTLGLNESARRSSSANDLNHVTSKMRGFSHFTTF